MSLEKYQEIIAIPRLHKEFLKHDHVKVLDPTMESAGQHTGKNANVYRPSPAFCWDTAHALQYLKDLQENTLQLAKEKNTSLLDRVNFQNQNSQALSADELQALQEFSGKSTEQNSEYQLFERAQRMLLIAYYNENLYLELSLVKSALARQQEKLKSLLDENEHVVQNAYQMDDVLLSWKQILPAFMLYTQEASAYFVNDTGMAEEIAALAKEKIEEKMYFCYAVDKDVLARFIGKEFIPYCKKNQYHFIVPKEQREGSYE